MTTTRAPARRGPLTASETAEGAVLAGLSVVLTFFGSFVPVGGALVIAAITPYAVLAYRHRARATFVAAGSAMAVLMVVLGPIGAFQQLGLAALGQVIGAGYRRGRGRPWNAAMSLAVVWLPSAVAVVAALAVLTNLRNLILEQVLILARTVSRLAGLVGLDAAGVSVLSGAEYLVSYWWIVVPTLMLAVILVVAMAAHGLTYPALARLRVSFGPPVESEVSGVGVDRGGRDVETAPAPVPMQMRDVTYRYPGAESDAVSGVDLMIEAGRFTVVVGDNGSGKSTVLALMAGTLEPTDGEVTAPGAAGLGRATGTALVLQRPETQVLGTHVGEDVVWGLDPETAAGVDVEEVLDRVGLGGMGDRETAGLSGGELQRLAIAAALARRPALLLSDESTSMLDAQGRRDVVTLLRGLADDGTAVVHVTHHAAEAVGADVVVRMQDGRVVEGAGQ